MSASHNSGLQKSINPSVSLCSELTGMVLIETWGGFTASCGLAGEIGKALRDVVLRIHCSRAFEFVNFRREMVGLPGELNTFSHRRAVQHQLPPFIIGPIADERYHGWREDFCRCLNFKHRWKIRKMLLKPNLEIRHRLLEPQWLLTLGPTFGSLVGSYFKVFSQSRNARRKTFTICETYLWRRAQSYSQRFPHCYEILLCKPRHLFSSNYRWSSLLIKRNIDEKP